MTTSTLSSTIIIAATGTFVKNGNTYFVLKGRLVKAGIESKDLYQITLPADEILDSLCAKLALSRPGQVLTLDFESESSMFRSIVKVAH